MSRGPVASPPEMSVPDTVAVRLPEVAGSNENLNAAIVRVAVGLPTAKVTVWERYESPSQLWSWTIATVTSSSPVVAPSRVSRR